MNGRGPPKKFDSDDEGDEGMSSEEESPMQPTPQQKLKGKDVKGKPAAKDDDEMESEGSLDEMESVSFLSGPTCALHSWEYHIITNVRSFLTFSLGE